MIKFDRPIVFIDFETTGTDVLKDRIVQIAACKLMLDAERIVKNYLVNPGIPIPEAATKVHGIRDADVADKPPFCKLAKNFMEFIQGCDVGGFNSNHYDFPLMYIELLRCGITWDYHAHRFVDSGNIYKIKEPRTLAAAYRFYTGNELEKAHDAEADILATVDVFQEQVNTYFSGDEEMDMEQLDFLCNYDKKRLDMAGKFAYGEDGKTIIFNFGPQAGKPATDYGFLQWMLKKDFPPDTLALAKKLSSEIPYR